jgi:ABC-type sugar transport system permease subunit
VDRRAHQHAVQGLHRRRQHGPLFVPPLVAGVAWGILGSPKTGLLNTALKWMGIDFR